MTSLLRVLVEAGFFEVNPAATKGETAYESADQIDGCGDRREDAAEADGASSTPSQTKNQT